MEEAEEPCCVNCYGKEERGSGWLLWYKRSKYELIKKPCSCKGSCGFIHRACLLLEIEYRMKNMNRESRFEEERVLECNICKNKYNNVIFHNKSKITVFTVCPISRSTLTLLAVYTILCMLSATSMYYKTIPSRLGTVLWVYFSTGTVTISTVISFCVGFKKKTSSVAEIRNS